MERLLHDKKMIAVFVAPALLLFACILLGPMIYGLSLSLFDWNAISAPKFIGVDNFTRMLGTLWGAKNGDVYYFTALKNSMFFVFWSLCTQQLLGLIVAIVLTNNIKFKNLFKNVFYLPVVLSSAAVGLLWQFIYNPKIGLLNQGLAAIGLKALQQQWLVKGAETVGTWAIPLPMFMIGICATWQYMGSSMMLYMAAIQGIPETLYEAAYIDGASRIRCIRYITLPLIKSMIKISTVLSAIGSLKFFDLIYTMTQGNPGHATEVLASHLYLRAFQSWEYGYGSAIAVSLVILCLFFTFVLNKLIRVESYEM